MIAPQLRLIAPAAAWLCLWPASTVAMAQAQGLNPALRVVKPSKVTPAPLDARPQPAGDTPVPPAVMLPPIDLRSVPPMPMPKFEADPDEGRFPPTSDLVIHDAETGRTQVVPRDWTPPPGRAGDPSAGSLAAGTPSGPASSWLATMSMVTAADMVTYPARANVKLIMQFTTAAGMPVYYNCSGTMIDWGTVLTAGHCLYNRNGDTLPWADKVWVLPAWDGNNMAGDRPSSSEIQQHFGWALGSNYMAYSGWIDWGNMEFDLAAIAIHPSSRSVGNLTGTMGWYWEQCGIDTLHHNYSYPGQPCGDGVRHTGRQMYFWSGEPDLCPTYLGINSYTLFTTPGCLSAVWGGMSGSGLYRQDPDWPYVGAVCSNSDRAYSSRYCGIWGGAGADLISYVDSSRGYVVDYELLRYRIGNGTTPIVHADGPIGGGQVLLVNPTYANPPSMTVTVRVRSSEDAVLDANDIILGEQSFPVDLGPRDTAVLDLASFELPWFTPTGDRFIGLQLINGPDGNPGNDSTHLWDMQQVNVQPCPQPPTPTGVDASDGQFCDRVRITWDAVPGVVSSRVWRHTLLDPNPVLIGTVAGTMFDDMTAVVGGDHWYRVSAINDCDEESHLSAEQFGFRANPTIGTPHGVVATDGTRCDGVLVTWKAAASAAFYSVRRNTVDSASGAALIATGIQTLFHLDTTAADGTTYYYFIKAHNACTVSDASTGNAGFRGEFAQVIGVVQPLDVSCLGVQLTWPSAPGATGYHVYRGVTNNPYDATFLATVPSNAYTDSNSPPGVPHYYWVKAVNSCGTNPFGGFSATPRTPVARPGLPPPAGPAVVSDPTYCAPSISVSWEGRREAATYRVLRSSPRGETRVVGVTSQTTFEDLSADPGVRYDYAVVCVDGCGQESQPGPAGTGSRGGPPVAPGNVRAGDAPTCRSVVVSWDLSAGATSYEIRRGLTNEAGRAERVGESVSPPFVDQSAPEGVEMHYWVVALSPCGESSVSDTDVGAASRTGEATISRQPTDLTVDEGRPASFEVVAGGATAWAWRFNGQPLSDGRGISGASRPMLTIDPATGEHAGRYDCVVTTSCGTVTSVTAELTVTPPPPCFADFNQDGGVDGEDVNTFFAAWEAGDGAADTNLDGGIDGSDVDVFFRMWEAGGC